MLCPKQASIKIKLKLTFYFCLDPNYELDKFRSSLVTQEGKSPAFGDHAKGSFDLFKTSAHPPYLGSEDWDSYSNDFQCYFCYRAL